MPQPLFKLKSSCNKILLQRLWEQRVGWDESIPEDLVQQWQEWRYGLPSFSKHSIPQRFMCRESPIIETQLHGFSNASSAGYGGVIYIRLLHATVSVSLVTAKTRVAPLKALTIPKLELCGALLTARLLTTVAADLRIPETRLFAWTDSTIVLGWLSRISTRWKVFGANRVEEIQSLIPASQWRHVSTSDNPANHASRGLSPTELFQAHLW